MKIAVKPLTVVDFRPYGEVICVPGEPGRVYFENSLGNLRKHAHPSLSTVLKPGLEPSSELRIELLERHEFSSQTFVPMGEVSWLIVVCPHMAGGGPDVARSVAFLADGSQGVSYHPNTWHHGLTVIGNPGKFAIFMWRDGTSGDEEFVKVAPFDVVFR